MTDLNLPTLPANYRFKIEAIHSPGSGHAAIILQHHRPGDRRYVRVDVTPDPKESKYAFLRALGYMVGVYRVTRTTVTEDYWRELSRETVDQTDNALFSGATRLVIWLDKREHFTSRIGTYPPKA